MKYNTKNNTGAGNAHVVEELSADWLTTTGRVAVVSNGLSLMTDDIDVVPVKFQNSRGKSGLCSICARLGVAGTNALSAR